MTPPIGSGVYQWMQLVRERDQELVEQYDAILADVAAAGLTGFEPFAGTQAEADVLQSLLVRHHLHMPSAYANVELHTADWKRHADACIANALHVKPLGVAYLVVNPIPIRWGGTEDKDDAQLRIQADSLRYLHGELARHGITLSYHTHDPEMRAAAREFHHMLHATRDVGMTLCLDAHWIYRGAGNSNVALLDIVERYADRVSTLHLRQSHGGTWCELLEPGDVDYAPIAKVLKAAGFNGPANLEICQEQGTQRTMALREAHRRSAEWFRQLWESA